MNIVIIDYGAGNVRSVEFAVERLGIKALTSNDPEAIMSADKVIFPGVGEASTAMQALNDKGLTDVIPSLRQPVLGICLGMQLLCRYSEEGDTAGLNVFPVDVLRFDERQKVPHMGWNNLVADQAGLFAHMSQPAYVYYVHSYYVPVCAYTIATCEYGKLFSAALQKDNFFACQFHPEKSAGPGATILRNFLVQS